MPSVSTAASKIPNLEDPGSLGRAVIPQMSDLITGTTTTHFGQEFLERIIVAQAYLKI